MQFTGTLRAVAAAAALGAALMLAACGGGSSAPTTTASSAHTKAVASAPATTASSAGASEALACKNFHRGSAGFAADLRSATDAASRAAAYGGFVPVVDQDESGTGNTPLSGLLDTLVSKLTAQGSAELSEDNPSNKDVVSALNAVFALCQPLDPSENWSTGN